MPDEYRPILFAAMGLCALMIPVNLMLYRRRGVSSLFLAAAFAGFAGLLWALSQNLGSLWLGLFGAIVGGWLLTDAYKRAGRTKDDKKP